jgi:hydroxypyruvate isomerase
MTTASICLEMIYEDGPFPYRIDRVAELGFDTVEFWTRDDKDLEAIEARLDEHDLALTNLVGITEQAAPEDLSWAMTDPEQWAAAAVGGVEESIEVAQRLNCPFLTVHPGPEQDLPYDRTYESVVEGLTAATAAVEEAGVTISWSRSTGPSITRDTSSNSPRRPTTSSMTLTARPQACCSTSITNRSPRAILSRTCVRTWNT